MSKTSLLRAGERVRVDTRDESYEGIYNGRDDDWFCILEQNAFKTLIPCLDVVKVVVLEDAPEPKKKEAG